MAWKNSDSGRQAVAWLATAYILVIGAGASAFVIVVATERPQGPLMILGSVIAGLVLLGLILTIRWDEPISQLKFWLSAQDRSDPTDDYRAARRKIRSREQLGENPAPTIESVRDAANHGGAWVPRSSGTPRPPRHS